jgi:hypothetical protein
MKQSFGPALLRICCLEFDTFFVSVERLLNPSLIGKTMVIGDFVAPLPPPNTTSCKHAAAQLLNKPTLPAPSLQIVMGRGDVKTKQVAPFEHGEFVPLVHGGQGLLHVDVAIRVTIPGAKGADRKLRLIARAFSTCDAVGIANQPTLWAGAATDKAETFHNIGKVVPGVHVVINTPGSQSLKCCGAWFEMRVWVLDHESGAWGTASAQVRAHDTIAYP